MRHSSRSRHDLGRPRPADGVAAYVAATVVSTSVPGHVVLDAGAKTLTKDRASFLEGYGAILRFLDKYLKGAPSERAASTTPGGARK